MKVYKLKANGNRYQSLVPSDRKESLDIFQRFDGTAIGSSWRPWKVEVFKGEGYENLPESDFPLFAVSVPVFSMRAAEALDDLLSGNGELLALSCNEGSYVAYNVTRIIDALDYERSSLVRFSDGGIMDIAAHEFFPEKITAEIFKLWRSPGMDVFVTDQFKEAVQKHGLTGLVFEPVWEFV